MGLGYRLLAFIAGIFFVIGSIASIVTPLRKNAELKGAVQPQQAVVQTIERPLRRSLRPYTISAYVNSDTASKRSVEIESYAYHSPGSQITVFVNHEGSSIIADDKVTNWVSVVISVFLFGCGVLLLMAAIMSRKTQVSLSKKSRPFAAMSIARPDLHPKDSKWADAAMVTSLFNLVLLIAPITAPLSIIFAFVALRDITKRHKTGKRQVIFTFVFSGFFLAGMIILALIS